MKKPDLLILIAGCVPGVYWCKCYRRFRFPRGQLDVGVGPSRRPLWFKHRGADISMLCRYIHGWWYQAAKEKGMRGEF